MISPVNCLAKNLKNFTQELFVYFIKIKKIFKSFFAPKVLVRVGGEAHIKLIIWQIAGASRRFAYNNRD